MKIVAVVPTYNRPNMLKSNLTSLLNQTRQIDQIVVVDNASERTTREMLEQNGFLAHPRIVYVRVDVNVGASGGFKRALETAAGLEADWIWGMDDDAFPQPEALATLLATDMDPMVCYWSNCDKDKQFDGSYKQVPDMMFVGFFLHRSLLQKVGMPDERFYMYYDDIDYSERIYDMGGRILKVRDSVIDHDDWRTRGESPFDWKRFLFWRVAIFNGDPYRLYYMARNGYFIGRRGALAKAKYWLRQALVAVKYAIYRPACTPLVLRAMADISLNRRGRRDYV